MKSIYPIYSISTPLRVTNCRGNWELAAMGVEYLFIGSGNRNHWQITDIHDDFRYISIGALNGKPQLDQRSGRYRQRNTVPT